MFDSGHNDSEIYAGVKRTSRNLRIADHGIGGKRALAAGLVVDDRRLIGPAGLHAGAGEFERRRGPGVMDQMVRQCCELRHPAPELTVQQRD